MASSRFALRYESMPSGWHERLVWYSQNNDVPGVTQAINNGAEPDFCLHGGFSALYWAAEEKNVEIIRILLKNGASPDWSGRGRAEPQYDPLYMAVKANRMDIVQALIDHVVDPNISSGALNPLYAAVENNNEAIVELLIDHGAIRPLADEILSIAAENRNLMIIGYLLECKSTPSYTKDDCTQAYLMLKGCPTSLLYAAVYRKHSHMVLELSFVAPYGNDKKQLEIIQTVRLCTQCSARLKFKESPPIYLQDSSASSLETVVRNVMSALVSSRNRDTVLVVRLLGAPGSGKTTLTKSLRSVGGILTRVLGKLERDKGDSKPEARTKGINIYEGEGVLFVDVGGQYSYMANHQRLLRSHGLPVLNILMQSLVEAKQTMQTNLRTWGTFMACCEEEATTSNLLVVGTRDDRASKLQKKAFNEEHQRFAHMMGDAFKCLPPILADVREGSMRSVREIKNVIRQMKEAARTQASKLPGRMIDIFLYDIQAVAGATPMTGFSTFVHLLSDAIASRYSIFHDLTEKLESLLPEVFDIKKELQELHQECRLFYFPEQEAIVLHPQWLMGEITSKLFSTPELRTKHVKCDSDGWAPRQHVLEVLAQGSSISISGEKALEIAVMLGMCLQHGEDVLVLPARDKKRSSRHWSPPQPHSKYAGRQLHCMSGVALSSSVIPAVQMALTKAFCPVGKKFPLWQQGITLQSSTYPGAESLVEASSDQLSINVISRGTGDAKVDEFNHAVWFEVEKAAVTHSPGSEAESIFIADQNLDRDRIHELDAADDLGNGMEFLAMISLRDKLIAAATATDECSLPLEPATDPRFRHPYTEGASCTNVGTLLERQRARRYCSALFHHRGMLRLNVDAVWCAIRLAEAGEVSTRLRDDTEALMTSGKKTDAVDLLLHVVCDLPDSVVVTLVQDVFTSRQDHRELAATIAHCPGYAQCETKSVEHHSGPLPCREISPSSSGVISDPWKTAIFREVFRPQIIRIESELLRTTVRSCGMIDDDAESELSMMRSPAEHNTRLLESMSRNGRESFVTFMRALDEMGYSSMKAELTCLLSNDYSDLDAGVAASAHSADPWQQPQFSSFLSWIHGLDTDLVRTAAISEGLLTSFMSTQLQSLREPAVHHARFLAYVKPGGVHSFRQFLAVVTALGYDDMRTELESLLPPDA